MIQLHYSSKKSILSPVQPISATNVDRIKYYLDPVEEIYFHELTVNLGNLVGSHIAR